MPGNIMIYIWLSALIIFLIAEGVTTQLVSLWFCIGSLIAGVLAFLHCPIWLQITVFFVSSAIILVLVRPIYKKLTKCQITPTNADRIIGKHALVTEAINNLEGTGAIKINGQTWTARTADNSLITADTLVVIKNIEGVKAIVTKE